MDSLRKDFVMSHKVTSFDTLMEYIEALQNDEKLAVVPLQEVADHRGVTRAAVVRMLSVGQLDEVKIGRNRYVRAWSLIDREEVFRQEDEAIRAYLEECARAGETVFYEPVMAIIGLSWRVPADRKRIGMALGRVSEATWSEHGVLLSVLVHRKTSGITRPGPGFFDLLKGLEDFEPYPKGEEDAIIARETQRVFDFYASQ